MKRTGSVGVRTYGTARQNPSVGLVSAGGLVYGYVVLLYVVMVLCVCVHLHVYFHISSHFFYFYNLGSRFPPYQEPKP